MNKTVTEKDALVAIKKYNWDLCAIPEELRTAELCRIAVQKIGFELSDVPKKLRTAELCRIAVQQDGYRLLRYVPKKLKTAELCRIAVQQDGYSLKYVSKELKTAELCRIAIDTYERECQNTKYFFITVRRGIVIYSEDLQVAIAFTNGYCMRVAAKASDSDTLILKEAALYSGIPIVQQAPKLALELLSLRIGEELPDCYREELIKKLTGKITGESEEKQQQKDNGNNGVTKKVRFINSIATLSDDEKEFIIDFFSKHPNYESHIDWNNKNLAYIDFEQVFSLAAKSKASRRREAKAKPELLFKEHNCKIIAQTDEYLIVVPLDWECAVYFNSFSCGNEGAKWCIGSKYDFNHWYSYLENGWTFFFIYFYKKHPSLGRKVMAGFNREYNFMGLWLQDDTSYGNILEQLPERLIENKEKQPFNVCLKLWYYHLQSENQRIGQLYLDFGVMDLSEVEAIDNEIFDAVLVKEVMALLIHDNITLEKIDEADEEINFNQTKESDSIDAESVSDLLWNSV